jgi:hypothetical protein
MQSSSGQSTTNISSIRDRPSPNSIIRTNKFHARSYPTAWFIIFEAYLVQFNPSEWIYHVITAINEDTLSRQQLFEGTTKHNDIVIKQLLKIYKMISVKVIAN